MEIFSNQILMQSSSSSSGAVKVIESWRSADGTQWGRKWSDGLIEQWGGGIHLNTGSYSAPSQTVINLIKPYSDDKYYINTRGFVASSTATSVTLSHYSDATDYGEFYICGY